MEFGTSPCLLSLHEFLGPLPLDRKRKVRGEPSYFFLNFLVIDQRILIGFPLLFQRYLQKGRIAISTRLRSSMTLSGRARAARIATSFSS